MLGRTEAAPAQTDVAVEMDALIQNAIRTSEIEGEHLDAGAVRLSVARQLGLEQTGVTGRPTPESDSLVALLLEATHQPEQLLSCEQLCRWQAQLFPVPSILSQIVIDELRGEHPMHVISGRMDQPIVHFEAPPRQGLEQQRHATTPLSERQIKVLNRLLDNAGEEFKAGINARTYQALAKVSKATSTRDLADLVEKGCLQSLPGGGRSSRYGLAL